MRIRVVRSGGVAGLRLEREVEAREQSAAGVKDLERLVEKGV